MGSPVPTVRRKWPPVGVMLVACASVAVGVISGFALLSSALRSGEGFFHYIGLYMRTVIGIAMLQVPFALIIAGIGMLLGKGWGRLIFLVVFTGAVAVLVYAKWMSVHSGYGNWMWENAGLPATVPVVFFLLTRRKANAWFNPPRDPPPEGSVSSNPRPGTDAGT